MSTQSFYSCFIGVLVGLGVGLTQVVSYRGALCVLVLAVFFILYARLRALDTRVALILTAVVFGCVFGYARGAHEAARVFPLTAREGTTVALTGTIAREVSVRERTQQVLIRDDATGELVLAQEERGVTRLPGDRVRATGTLTVPDTFDTETGRVFDYPKYLRAQGIAHVLRYPSIVAIGTDSTYALYRALLAVKHAATSAVSHTLPEPDAGFANAMTFGVVENLGNDLSDIFRNVGLVHIVVLSGTHVSFVFLGALFILSFLRISFRVRTIGALAVVWLFGLTVGLSATVVRALVMVSIAVLGICLGRRRTVVRALSVALLIMLAHSPYALFDPGLQLSFLASYAIIGVAPALERILVGTLPLASIRTIVAATLATELLIFPLLAFSMGQLPLMSVPANLFVLPIVPFAMLATLVLVCMRWLAHLLPLMNWLVSVCAWVTGALYAYMRGVAEVLAGIPHVNVLLPVFSTTIFWMLYAVVACFAALLCYAHYGMPHPTPRTKKRPTLRGWTIVGADAFIRAREDAARSLPS